MARRKKQTKQTPIKTTSTIAYQGTIKVSVQKNGKTLKTQTFHNTGDAKLFKFLGSCLIGEFNRELRPCRIRLFTIDTDSAVPDNPDNPHWCDSCAISSYILADEADYNKIDSAEETGVSVTYSFKLPCIYIDSNKSRFCKLGLFPNSISDLAQDICAHYVFRDSADQTKFDETSADLNLEPYAGKNYILFIEWTLALMNMTTTTTTTN